MSFDMFKINCIKAYLLIYNNDVQYVINSNIKNTNKMYS